MKKVFFYIILTAQFALISCQDIIDLDLPEGDKLVVLNGILSDTIPVWVDVLQTANYNEDGSLPKIDGATVFVFENGIQTAQLFQDSTGRYSTDYIGTIGNNYHIQVLIPQDHPELGGTIWQSQDEELRYCSPIDSMYQKFLPENIFQDSGQYVFYHFEDPSGTGDRYRIRIWKNDTVGDQPQNITVFEDFFFDGRKFNDKDLPALQLNSRPAKIGDFFRVEHSSISKSYFDYLSLVQEQTLQVGGLFDAPPALLIGNIKGVTDPEKLALGYFAVTGLKYGEYTVVE